MKIILDIIHDYGHAFKLDFDKFPLDGLSTIQTLKKIYYNKLCTTELKLANTYIFVYFALHCGGNFIYNFAKIYTLKH